MAESGTFRAIESRPPPVQETGPLKWVKENLFGSVTNTIITLLCLYALYEIAPPTVNWLLLKANLSGTDRQLCDANPGGACWTFVKIRLPQFFYGLTFTANPELLWRPLLAFATLVAMLGALIYPNTPYKKQIGLFALFGFPIYAYAFIEGSLLGLRSVPTYEWGGFMLNLSIAYVCITASLPFGIVLALGRRSRLPVIRAISVTYIEFFRSAPLITFLFMSSVMLPLFFPPEVEFNKVLRAMMAFILFEAAYLAEVVRGGLQAMPRGQYEAADALGLSYWKKMALIILPQSLRISIPGIVNTFIALFKDTSLVLIIGLLDVLTMATTASRSPEWKGYDVEGLIFAALLFWICTYSMSQYSRYIERKLDRSKRS